MDISKNKKVERTYKVEDLKQKYELGRLDPIWISAYERPDTTCAVVMKSLLGNITTGYFIDRIHKFCTEDGRTLEYPFITHYIKLPTK